MEVDLLKEPWVFPQTSVNAIKGEEQIVSSDWKENIVSPIWEEKTVSSAWQENFQDLSSWCMDTFQAQCDFHTGEPAAFKLSGTKYEGDSALLSEEGVSRDWRSGTNDEKWRVKMNTAETAEYSSDNCHSLQAISDPTIKYTKEEDHKEAISNMSNSWVKVPRETADITNITMWNNEDDAHASTPAETKYHVEDLDIDDGCPTSFDSTECQPETWDMLRTIESAGSDSFNLLSYLCDDEIGSPDGSIISTDSTTVSKVWPDNKSATTVSQPSIKAEMGTKNVTIRSAVKSRTTSTVTSSSSTDIPVVSRRSTRMRNSSTNKIEKSYSKVKQEKRGTRRGKSSYTDDTDSDDRSYVSHYRESREKNNEASRKSRMNKKAKESEMLMRANELEKDNRILKMKVEELEKLVTSMRSALLKSALKKEF